LAREKKATEDRSVFQVMMDQRETKARPEKSVFLEEGVPLGNKVRLDFLVRKVKKASKALWVRVTLDLPDSRDRKVKRVPRGIRVFPVVWDFQV